MPGTTTNAADGTVTFDQLPFDAAGTYEYTLVQVAGNADGVTYDSTEYAATIHRDRDGRQHTDRRRLVCEGWRDR